MTNNVLSGLLSLYTTRTITVQVTCSLSHLSCLQCVAVFSLLHIKAAS